MYDISTKPYLIRAIYEWCVDQGFTPYLAVKVDANTKVPREYVKDGQIVLNISYTATRHLKIGNEMIQFSARFGGVSRELEVPIGAVMGIFAKENGHGMFFQPGPTEEATSDAPVPAGPDTPSGGKPPRGPHLKIVK